LVALWACSAEKTPVDCDEEIAIGAATFWMGCNSVLDSACEADELPQHRVELEPYRIDRCEVSVARYARCVEAGACTAAAQDHSACNGGAAGRELHPINCVDRPQALSYCAWARAGGRLPTEAEWELAARGGCDTLDGDCRSTMRTWPWGEQPATCQRAVMDDGGGPGCGAGGTAMVASKPAGASPYGLHDMAGNVWEWTADRYAPDWYGRSPARNPVGPATGGIWVVRGGRFGGASYSKDHLRGANRDLAESPFLFEGLGFRCARGIP